MAAGDDPKPTVLILHGLPGIEQNHDLAHALRDHGWNVLIFNYRGCWGSGGSYAFKNQPDDAVACIDYLEEGKHPQVDLNRLIVIGHSMGGWAAIHTAARDERVKAICAISAVGDPARLRFDDNKLAEEEFYPWLPGHTLETFGELWRELGRDRAFDPAVIVRKISPRPLLMIHPEPDDVVPIDHARNVFEKAGEPKQWLSHPEANHSFTWHRMWLIEHVLGWIDQLAL